MELQVEARNLEMRKVWQDRIDHIRNQLDEDRPRDRLTSYNDSERLYRLEARVGELLDHVEHLSELLDKVSTR